VVQNRVAEHRIESAVIERQSRGIGGLKRDAMLFA